MQASCALGIEQHSASSTPPTSATQPCGEAGQSAGSGGSDSSGQRGELGKQQVISASGDAVIAAAIQAGDHRRALLLCARAHGAAVGRLCMSMLGSQADAEEATHQTLLDAHDAFSRWQGLGSLRPWLLGLARRQCARRLERPSRGPATLRLVVDVDAESPSDGQVLKAQRALRARALLRQLRPSEREALLLRYGAGLSVGQVGQACGIDEGAARERVSSGVLALRLVLQQEEK